MKKNNNNEIQGNNNQNYMNCLKHIIVQMISNNVYFEQI